MDALLVITPRLQTHAAQVTHDHWHKTYEHRFGPHPCPAGTNQNFICPKAELLWLIEQEANGTK